MVHDDDPPQEINLASKGTNQRLIDDVILLHFRFERMRYVNKKSSLTCEYLKIYDYP